MRHAAIRRELKHLVGRCAHTPPLSFRPNKSGAHIASTLGEVARRSRDGGVKVHQTQKIHGNRRHGGALRSVSPRMASNRKISPHQSLRDSFSSRRSRLTAHCLRFRGARRSRDGGFRATLRTKYFNKKSAGAFRLPADLCD